MGSTAYRISRAAFIKQGNSTLARDTYIFDDWNGPEDVFQLARLYLDKLDELVRDGQARGILTRVEEERVMTIS